MSTKGLATDLRSDTGGIVWGLRAFDGPNIIAASSNGRRLFSRDHWAALTPVPAGEHHLFPYATGAETSSADPSHRRTKDLRVEVREHTNPTLPSVWQVLVEHPDRWQDAGMFDNEDDAVQVADRLRAERAEGVL